MCLMPGRVREDASLLKHRGSSRIMWRVTPSIVYHPLPVQFSFPQPDDPLYPDVPGVCSAEPGTQYLYSAGARQAGAALRLSH
jgi:hypothetical protein